MGRSLNWFFRDWSSNERAYQFVVLLWSDHMAGAVNLSPHLNLQLIDIDIAFNHSV